ncbi:MAG: hypothetical protein ABIK61_06405, partial [candidate division WOR-3 bacterium]
MSNKISFGLIFSFIFITITLAQYPDLDTVQISGTIANDTTWTSNKIIIITGDVTISSTATLTVQAGTIVKFLYTSSSFQKKRLTVDGRLNVQGTAANPVYFTS